ncbi:MmcQ/YjbR family DNA-binding protein [Tateyamaria sp. SN6-1]|uniref:MmcQ/YjbR family DNA-binding protein n=1 Tax=Tateyamaria sp. SN6-1 TaxID=3092148 RepID=UPI0039F4DC7E
MTRNDIDAICAALPGAWFASHQDGGLEAWKVGDKMFATIGMAGDGVSVKCADVETAQMLIEVGAAIKAKYFHRSWVRVPFDGADPDLMRARIQSSYTLIRTSLPKKTQATLAPWPSQL